MSVVKLEAGPMKLAKHGKKMVAHAMFHRGKLFIKAAVLLDREDNYQYVVLHLFCQGLEIILKALLLIRNFDLYSPKLPKSIGHNLIKAADTVRLEFGAKPLRKEIMGQLKGLSNLYEKHLLRYGSVLDILIDPASITCDLVFKKAVQLIILGNRIFKNIT